MRWIVCGCALIVVLIAFASCSVSGLFGDQPADASVSASTSTSESQITVAFVGNGYTYTNDLPRLASQLAQHAGYSLEVFSYVRSGASLYTHAESLGTARQLERRSFDYVVLQDQGVAPVLASNTEQAQALVDAARVGNPEVGIVYYVTPSYRDGLGTVETFDQFTASLLSGYRGYQTTTGGELALVGPAYQMVVEDSSAPFPPTDLWQADGGQFGLLGSYLAAAVIVSEMFDASVVGATVPDGIEADYGRYLQQVADRVSN